jgi:hypothetical protein
MFALMSSDRPVGLTAGAIPSHAILSYLKEVEEVVDPAELRFSLRLLRVIDDEYLKAIPRKSDPDRPA